ncbi:MAG: DUF2393 family protein [Sulfuricurvum sp.]|uniref:DUF2393 family protein n=1 Tax=Sulfuricurvum sp. TaxID=2025608 RepID=UPI0026296C07|nr:DUF2393 family protein [Sulfuricurvum sp.]MDD2828181.1 DUF2393 family protein [Sulfuricurvum sp.]MDD4949864.1 DUF2393 family protein [Sulfuricurvum sp.]
MNTYFTLWHYAAITLMTLGLIALIIMTLRKENEKYKFSIIFTYILAALGFMFGAILIIDSYTKKITLSDVKDTRFLPTEKIFFTGYVSNSGNYTIGEVSVEIKIVNRDTPELEGKPAYQSNAFAELIGDKGVKPSYLVVTEVVATNLKPGHRKEFRIIMRHPPYFKGYTKYIRAFGQ